MTATGFTPLEAATLLRLWDDEPEFWRFLYHLSDRFLDDGDEEAARFIRWLVGWGYRPANHRFDESYAGWWWWTYSGEEYTRRSMSLTYWIDYGANTKVPTAILPPLFSSVSASHHYRDRRTYGSLAECLEAAMDCWRTFTEEQKVDLEANWRASQ